MFNLILCTSLLSGCLIPSREGNIDTQPLCDEINTSVTLLNEEEYALLSSVTDGDGLSALVACLPLSAGADMCQDHLLVRDEATGQLLDISSECFLPWRPISSVEWLSEGVLQLDQWASPAYGNRYVIDLALGAVTRIEHLNGQAR
jgi:hypothetical protein